ncbi:hypothetical protein ACRE_041040 [Hapsidospora chrysogenum ATCC 11550]|uniref:Uncharacterized protein n=1 Tax=Hapsidospora chrysogenum (strain ATCC 11550 / CBS 779.69 / DSM 880 / IAM 14645 / JCM 23072 / IMI 49137) TaxID=857340 RepID=A0A086T6R7_HAPC1|nr:hypothetical protein ACRE_041040 [Hapsidospora chrysogenum ATCC 11550]
MCTPAAMRRRVKFAKKIECVDQPVTHTREGKPLDIDRQPDEGHTEALCPPPNLHTMPCTLSRYRPKKLWTDLLLPVDMHSLQSAEDELRSEDCDADGGLVARGQELDDHPFSDFRSLPLARVRKITASRFNELVTGEFMGKFLMYFAQPVSYRTTCVEDSESNASTASSKQDGQAREYWAEGALTDFFERSQM